jgi:hypothetical protein
MKKPMTRQDKFVAVAILFLILLAVADIALGDPEPKERVPARAAF